MSGLHPQDHCRLPAETAEPLGPSTLPLACVSEAACPSTATFGRATSSTALPCSMSACAGLSLPSVGDVPDMPDSSSCCAVPASFWARASMRAANQCSCPAQEMKQGMPTIAASTKPPMMSLTWCRLSWYRLTYTGKKGGTGAGRKGSRQHAGIGRSCW